MVLIRQGKGVNKPLVLPEQVMEAEVLCIFCSETCDRISSLNPINEHQARSLGTVLNFEYSGPPLHAETKFLNTLPCPRCLEWVSEAESVVQEWELILDKIRTIASHFKQVMNRKHKHKPRKRVIEQHNQNQSKPELIHDCSHKLEENHFDFEPHPAYSWIGDSIAKNILTSVTFPPLTEPLHIPLDTDKYESLTGSDNDIEDGLVDPLSTSPVVENGPMPKIPRLRRTRLQKNILRKSCTYVMETNQGPVQLQHFQIKIQRCDEPTFVIQSRPRRRSSPVSARKFRERMKRLRQKAQRRHDTSQNVKRQRGRPTKYKLIQGPEEECPNPKCDFKSTDPDQLAGHFRNKHLSDPFPFRCREPNCERVFKEFRRLVAHRGTHQGLFPFNCGDCGKQFQRNSGLTYHMLVKHTENPVKFPCDHCDKSFFTVKALNSHTQFVHGTTTFRCTIVDGCEVTFKAKNSLRHHQRRAHPEKFPNLPHSRNDPTMCAECGVTFLGKIQFKRHMLKHEGVSVDVIKPHACAIVGCRFRAVHKSELRRHIHVVHETQERTVKCDLPSCQALFKTRVTARSHFQKCHMPKTESLIHPCKVCGMSLANKRTLRDHIATQHTAGNKADFPCPQCSRGFPTPKYLRRHQKKYPNCEPKEPGPNAAYCEPCKKYCSNLAGLKRHNLLVHNSEWRPFECDKCGKKFPIRMYLLRHERESKTCIGSKANQDKALTSPSDESLVNNIPDKGISETQPKPPPVTEGIGTPEISGGQRHQEMGHPGNSLIQVPFTTQTPSAQVQQDFYFAFYGLQTSNPQ